MKKQINTHREAHHSKKTIKVMVMFIIFTVLLLGNLSAFEWDNGIEYRNNDLTVDFENGYFFGIGEWFGLNEKIGEATLKSHQFVDEIIELGFGEEKVVIYYDFNNWSFYKDGLGTPTFTNMKTGKIEDKDYHYVEWKEVDIPTYNYQCLKFGNGTIKNDCSGIQNGTTQEFQWVNYTSNDIPERNTRIGVKTYVRRNDYYDIVLEVAGKKIKKHAQWTGAGGLRSKTQHYYKYDGNFTDSVGTNDGTNDGTTNISGKLNSARFFNGDDLVNHTQENYESAITYSFWFQPNFTNVTLNGAVIFTKGTDGGTLEWISLVDDEIKYFFDGVVTSQNSYATDSANIVDDSMNHILLTGTGSGVGAYEIWVNGVNQSVTHSGSGDRPTGSVNNMFIGGDSVILSKFTIGIIDEFLVGNATMNEEEILFLYNNGNACAWLDDNCGENIANITLDSPEDNTNFTLTNNVTHNATIFDATNITNVTFWLDNQINATNTTAGLNNTVWTFDVVGLAEGDHPWNFEACNFNDTCVNASARTYNVNTTPDIQFGAGVPVNEANITNDFFEVNVTLTEALFLNVTFDLYNVNGALNQSVTFANSSRSQVWSSLPDATYSYNVTTATFTNQFNSTATRNISVDANSPALIVTFPNETITFHAINTNLFVNWSVNDTNIDTCILEYESANTTLTCSDNTTSINITNILNRTITIYANDTFGNVNSTSRSWNYTIFQNSLTFNLETIGGNTEDFELNITKDSSLSISTVELIYNASSSSASFTLGDNSTITASLDVPNPSVDTNFSFLFSFTMSDDQIINTTSNNQSVLNFGISNCDTFTTLIFNFTMLDEENQTELSNVTIDYAFNLFDNSRGTLITNFSESSTANPTAVCINQNLTTSSFSLDAVLQYVSGNGSYLPRYHNILNFSLTNSTIPNNISLFDVLDTTATPFQLTFRDSLLVLAPNILINVNKQFVASNDFKTVEIPITDTNGQAILNLVRNTAIYNLIFIDIQGNIVATFNQISAFCEDITIGQCTLELDSASTVPETFNLSESLGVSGVITYNNATSTATLNFNSINNTAVTVRLVGTTQNQFGNRSVCDNSLTSTLGSITCDASGILATDNFLFLDVFSDGNYVSTTVININPSNPLVGGFYGSDGYFIAFMMLLLIIILFSEDKQALLVMLGMGWVAILIFGLVRGTIIGSVSGGIWLLVSIATMIWKLKQEEVG